MAEMALSGEESVGTGAQLAPNKQPVNRGRRKIFLPPWKNVFDIF